MREGGVGGGSVGEGEMISNTLCLKFPIFLCKVKKLMFEVISVSVSLCRAIVRGLWFENPRVSWGNQSQPQLADSCVTLTGTKPHTAE